MGELSLSYAMPKDDIKHGSETTVTINFKVFFIADNDRAKFCKIFPINHL